MGFCEDPGTPANGFKEISTYHFGGYATFACRSDLWLIGPEVIQCVIGDNPNEVMWGDDIPQCSGEYQRKLACVMISMPHVTLV